MPPPVPPRVPIQLNDLYAIASTAARIAQRAAYIQATSNAGPSASASTSYQPSEQVVLDRAAAPAPQSLRTKKLWPTQVKLRQGSAGSPATPSVVPPISQSPVQSPTAEPSPSRAALEEDKMKTAPHASAPASVAIEDHRNVTEGTSVTAGPEILRESPPAPFTLTSNLEAATPGPPPEQMEASFTEGEKIAATETVSADPPLSVHPVTPPRPHDEYDDLPDYDATTEKRATPMRASKVPSSRIARLMHYGTLGAGLAWGAAGSFLNPASQKSPDAGSGPGPSPFMSDSNIRRLVDKLSRMRGAALKLGQFLSIQDSNLLPPEIERVLLQVQNSANYMPEWQMERVMREELGEDWRGKFASFDSTPFAAASIGQVHHGVLSKDHPSHPNMPVAIKIQFPGIRESIESDLSYLRWLLSVSALLPKGLFLENTINQMRLELEDECDYSREAEMGRRFGEIFAGEGSDFEVPQVVADLCGKRVLTTQMMKGRPLSHVEGYSPERRNEIATSLLHLSLSELFSHRLMQTDPNFSNFLYSPRSRKVQLIDFGATREYSREFMDDWLRLLLCAVNKDIEGCKKWSIKVGYLLGTESDEMVSAHVSSMTLLGSPFRRVEAFDFTHQTLTEDIKGNIPLMLAQRKTPPPKETYSLNRKLSGTFLICSKLKATVDCRSVLRSVVDGYRFADGGVVHATPAGALEVRAGEGRVGGSPTGTRSFHTSLRRAEQPSFGAVSHTVRQAVDAARRRRKVREKFGINLGDRWPRSIVPPVTNDTTTAVDTLAQSPAGPSMSEPTSSSPSAIQDRTPTPAEKSSSAETPFGAVESSDTQRRAESESSTPKHTIRGISIPLKPPPPGAEDCCMSGCARCVYDLYKEDLEEYQESLTSVRSKLLEIGVGSEEWNVDWLGKMPTGGSGGGAASDDLSHEDKADEEVDAVIAGLDPSMKAFLEMERKMKRKQKEKKKEQLAGQ